MGEIQRRKWRWLRYTLRKDNRNPTRIVLRWNPQVTRKRGRPAHSWRREIEKEMKVLDLSWIDLSQTAQENGGPWPILRSSGSVQREVAQ